MADSFNAIIQMLLSSRESFWASSIYLWMTVYRLTFKNFPCAVKLENFPVMAAALSIQIQPQNNQFTFYDL